MGKAPHAPNRVNLYGFFLFLVGSLMGRYGAPGTVGTTTTWLVTGHKAATDGIIVCSYFFVCSFAISWGPVSWTYPSESEWCFAPGLTGPSLSFPHQGAGQGCVNFNRFELGV